MPKRFACALTHVRNENFFLKKWIAHYAPIVGRENLFVVIDGNDWAVDVDLTGLHFETVLDAPRQRIRNDRWIAEEMSKRANALRKKYDFVIRGDCDEYVVIDPAADLTWESGLQELGEDGYIFAMGIDMVQGQAESDPVKEAQPILNQRKFGFVSDRYSKPFVISRWNNWSGGAHRLLNRPVKLSQHFILFHMALADKTIAAARLAARGGLTQHTSHVEHQTLRLNIIEEAQNAQMFSYDEAMAIGRRLFPVESDGSPAKRPRAANVDGVDEKGLYVTIPDRFRGLV